MIKILFLLRYVHKIEAPLSCIFALNIIITGYLVCYILHYVFCNMDIW